MEEKIRAMSTELDCYEESLEDIRMKIDELESEVEWVRDQIGANRVMRKAVEETANKLREQIKELIRQSGAGEVK